MIVGLVPFLLDRVQIVLEMLDIELKVLHRYSIMQGATE